MFGWDTHSVRIGNVTLVKIATRCLGAEVTPTRLILQEDEPAIHPYQSAAVRSDRQRRCGCGGTQRREYHPVRPTCGTRERQLVV